MNLQDIEAFVALAETGSINRAALRLHLTQPAATRRIQNFEAALGGAALLDRSTKPPILTAAGHQALEHCRRVLSSVAELQASMAADAEPAGELRMGFAHGLADVVLTEPLDDLRRRYPKVRLQVTSNWTTRLIEDVRAGALECAVGFLTAGHAVPPAIEAAPLGAEEVVVVAQRAQRLPKKAHARLDDLRDPGWVLNPPGCGCRAALQRAFDEARVDMKLAAEIFGEDLQLAFIARNGGLGLVPRRQLALSPHRRHLQVVRTPDFALNVTIALLHRGGLGSLAAPVAHLRTRIAGQLRHHQ